MSPNPLDPAALISLLPTLLPPSSNLSTPHDALVALIHAAFSALAFRLTAVDESSSSSIYQNNVLPVEWNKSSPAHHSLKYKHEQSSLEFVVNISKLGGRTLINAIALEASS
jgi:proteasome inhibitor subunit 1 (PI31)